MKEQARTRKETPSPPPPTQSGHGKPDYKTFYRDFDESLRRHFEEHMRQHQKDTGISDAHLRAHMESVAAAHAMHQQAHARAMGIAHEAHEEENKYSSWANLLDGIWDGAEEDPTLKDHASFVKTSNFMH